ncbi:MAG TPA: GNAT family N-acetyltransferase [Candidatus Latescibacteria bacterium]|nr:GNAT family N-acetyltransferase [Candidatus Latescibacterota bacterium]HJP31851.1 GNAT family N-acetyltransferase [Candidatus Latescibacterota bacterium]
MSQTPITTIRELAAGDIARLVEIALAAWEPVFDSFEQILGSELFELTRPGCRESKAEQIRAACQLDAPGHVLVAQRGSTIAGFVSFYPDVPVPGVGEIGNNAVHPEFQRQGLAGMMYEEVFRRLKVLGIRYAKVRTGGDASHLPARTAYERVGFDISLPAVDYYREL